MRIRGFACVDEAWGGKVIPANGDLPVPLDLPWMRGRSGIAYDRALLCVGLLPRSLVATSTLPDQDELGRLLLEEWGGFAGRAWPWQIHDGREGLIRQEADVRHASEAIEALLRCADQNRRMDGRGLRLEISGPDPGDFGAVREALGRAGVHSVYWRLENEGDLAWSWPLRIGLARGSPLLTNLPSHSPLRPLFQTFHGECAPMQANLLLFDGSLPEAIQALEASPRRAPTDAAIVFGGAGNLAGKGWEAQERICQLSGAQGVFVWEGLDVARKPTAAEGLVACLSHDLPLDSAMASIAEEEHLGLWAWATRSLVEATSVREQGRVLVRRLLSARGARVCLDAAMVSALSGPEAARQREPGQEGGVFGPAGGESRSIWVGAQELGASLERHFQPEPTATAGAAPPQPVGLRFDRESHGAQTVAALAQAAAAELDGDVARRENRYLQARIEAPDASPVSAEGPLKAASDYTACVFIGVRRPEWLGLDQALETPAPPDGNPLMLHVLFWEPTVSPEPQLARVTLRAAGDSGVVRFPFRTQARQTVFAARIAVYHRNRNLQTGVLRGQVGLGPSTLTFRLDATPVPRFIGLADRAGVGASIIVNADPFGAKQAFIFRDGEASVTALAETPPGVSVPIDPCEGGSLAALTAALGRAIGRITTQPEEYTDLSKAGTRSLLLELALHGKALLTRLRRHSPMRGLFDGVDRIQLVMAHVDAFFPLEYLYDGEAPEDDARICSGPEAAARALASGTCCGAYAADPQHTICPLRFWGLSKVIERHAHLPEHASLDAKFLLRSGAVSARDRVLDPLRGAVLGASTAVDTAVPDTVKTLRTELEGLVRNRRVTVAGDWATWAKEIASAQPSLLVLLPHHLQEGGFDLLEIGGDKRKSMQIRSEHVRSPRDGNARPIVLLMGCQTSSAKVDLESFVPAFQDAGAVIVVSTIAAILGRHAGPAATAIVQELRQQQGNPDATFGDILRAVRRRLLLSGSPMVLGLTSYGDADWRIGAPGTAP
jgi:hypothetical protein